jgi:hypothetical protein
MSEKQELLKVAKREKTFSTLAKTEAKGAAKRALNEHGANKKDSQWEAKQDTLWANKRAKLAATAKKKASSK